MKSTVSMSSFDDKVDSKHSAGEFKYSIIIIGSVIKNPEKLKVVPGHFNTNNMCNYGVKEINFCKKICF